MKVSFKNELKNDVAEVVRNAGFEVKGFSTNGVVVGLSSRSVSIMEVAQVLADEFDVADLYRSGADVLVRFDPAYC